MVVAMTIVVVPVVSVPAVLVPFLVAMPAPITTTVVDRALDHYRTGRGDHDGRRGHVDRDTARADEAADHTADKSAERGVAGVVAVGKCARGERGQSRAGTECSDPFLHVVTSRGCQMIRSPWCSC
jgi:hypothetical protein